MSTFCSTCKLFNQDVSTKQATKADGTTYSAWDTSKVEYMARTFYRAYTFDQDLSNWDTSSVVSMQGWFQEAYSFNNGNQPLLWDTSKVTDMGTMFKKAYSFNQDISWLDASEVTTINKMLLDAVSFNRPLNEWDVPKLDSWLQGKQPFHLQTLEPTQDTESSGIFTWPTNNKMTYLDKCMASTVKVDHKYDWQTISTTAGDCPDRAAAPPVMCKDPGTTGYTMTNTDLGKDNFDVTGVCADGYGGSVTAEPCTEAGDYTVSGCDPACETNTCDNNAADKQFRIPNILAGDADTCCGPAWVVKCGLGTKVDITEGECVGDPSSYSDSGQLRARWRELNKCENEQ